MSAYGETCNAVRANHFNRPHELTAHELQQVSGGMMLGGSRESSNVVDARGGQSTFLFWKISYDANGHVSDISLK